MEPRRIVVLQMLNLPHPQRRRPGFSFIEMAVVVVILGLLAALAVPRYAAATAAHRVAQAAHVVVSDLEVATSLAAQHRVPLELTVDPSAPGYAVTVRDSSRVVLRRTLGAESEWRLQSVVGTPSPVTLFPGGTTSSPLRLVLTGGGHTRTVTLTRAGLARVLP